MWMLINVALSAYIIASTGAHCFHETSALGNRSIAAGLRPFLSKNADLSYGTSTSRRWSEYKAPTPGATVNVATERDVAATVKYCIANKNLFLAQNGASGWISSFNLGSNGLVINLRGLNTVSFNSERTQATIGGGTLISEAIVAAYANNAQVTTGNCNCAGTLGAILGGGYGNLMGLNGFGVDTLISVNYVNAVGELVSISSADTDLWWALRGAGPNFGIVTSAVVKSSFVPQNDSKAWLGGVIFAEDKLEFVVSAINNLKLEPKMNIFMYYVVSNSTPVILLTPFYYGDEATARQKFASIFAIGPVADTTAVTPYNHWNDGVTGVCTRGDRKPSYGAGMLQMIPTTWRAVWNEYVKFTRNLGTENSVVLLEAYSLGKARSVPDSSSFFPYRQVNFSSCNTLARDLWLGSDELENNSTYISFAYGDEDLEVVYGANLARLQALKKKYDPENVFSHWFSLAPRL